MIRSQTLRAVLLETVDWKAYTALVTAGSLVCSLGIFAYEIPRILSPVAIATGILTTLDPLNSAFAAHRPGAVGPIGNIRCLRSGTDHSDGCLDSPGGTNQHADCFTSYCNQNGQVYTTRPGFSVVSVDYADGIPAISIPVMGICGLDHVQDPATATHGSAGVGNPGCGILPLGCNYAVNVISSQLSVPGITCSGVTNPVVEGFDMRPVGGHGGTYLYFLANNIGEIDVKFNIWLGDPGLFYQNGLGSTVNGTHNDFVFYANTFDGNWPTAGSEVNEFTASQTSNVITVTAQFPNNHLRVGQYVNTLSLNVSNNAVIKQLTGTGGATCPDVTCDNTTGTFQTNKSVTLTSQNLVACFNMAGLGINTTGKLTWRYNHFAHMNGRPSSGTRTPSGSSSASFPGDDDWKFNSVEDMVYLPGWVGHGELWEGVTNSPNGPATWASVSYDHNFCLQGNGVGTGGTTTCFYMSTGNPVGQVAGSMNTYTNNAVTNNVAITNVTTNAPFKNPGASTGAALAEWAYVQYGNTTITGNFIDMSGATYAMLCTGAPYRSGVYSSADFGFLNPPVLSGNKFLISGGSADSSLSLSNCRVGP